MDITSYLLGKNAGGGGEEKQEFTLTRAGSSSVPAYQRILEQIDEITVDLSDWTYLFQQYHGSSIPKLIQTKPITGFSACFSYATFIRKIDLSNIDTSETTNMGSMFSNTNYLSVLDISSFDFSKVSAYSGIFNNCGSNASVTYGAYASGIPYVYVKDATAQAWVIEKQGGTWTTDNVVIKSN